MEALRVLSAFFTDIAAASFVAAPLSGSPLELTGWIASSIMYLSLAIFIEKQVL